MSIEEFIEDLLFIFAIDVEEDEDRDFPLHFRVFVLFVFGHFLSEVLHVLGDEAVDADAVFALFALLPLMHRDIQVEIVNRPAGKGFDQAAVGDDRRQRPVDGAVPVDRRLLEGDLLFFLPAEVAAVLLHLPFQVSGLAEFGQVEAVGQAGLVAKANPFELEVVFEGIL
jgi:hypothetical protein